MGISIHTISLAIDALKLVKQSHPNRDRQEEAVSMCELGNQHIRPGIFVANKYRTGKEYFKSRGVDHVSIDINGLDGALPFDLCKQISPSPAIGGIGVQNIGRTFDIVTNFGTVEHLDDMYMGFKNIHDLCSTGGIMVHALPSLKGWNLHCKKKFDTDFIRLLCEANDYDIIILDRIQYSEYGELKMLVRAIIEKAGSAPFCSRKQFERFPLYD